MDVDFKIETEDWNVYKLSDGSTLKTRYVLLKVGRTIDQAGNPQYGFSSQNLVATITPTQRKGTPDPRGYSPAELEASVVDELDFETVKEEENKYTLEDGSRIAIRLILTRVLKTDKYDPSGAPIYFTNTQTVIKPKLSKELKDRFVSTQRRSKKREENTRHIV
jgi:hypothetical protein